MEISKRESATYGDLLNQRKRLEQHIDNIKSLLDELVEEHKELVEYMDAIRSGKVESE